MRGLFVCPISADFPGNQGILNKMEYQQAALANLAGTVNVVCNSARGPLLCGKRIAEYPWTGQGIGSFNHYILFYHYVWKHCRSASYDFLYIRYPLAIPSFLRFLRATKKANPGTKIILEVPTFPYRQELRSPRQRVLLALDDLGHGRLKHYVDVVVTFFGQSEIFGIPCIQTANGIDVDQIPVAPGKPLVGPNISMIVVANLASWHGVDRLLRGLADYIVREGSWRVTLDVAGDGPAAQELRALCRELGIEDRVSFHGVRSDEELDALFAKADLAISSLGMHRLGLRRSSSLKAREYCARGVPFLLASEDPDFPEGIPFVCNAPADESSIDVAAMVAFIEKLHARNPSFSSDMREYAETRLTWKAKLEPVIHYVRTGEIVEKRA
jgi:glycosyltransferase involved in cell wall biosynthesis